MSDLPVDVRDTLAQLFREAGSAARSRDAAEVDTILETAATVTTNKVPDPDLRTRLLHGCHRAREVVDGEPLVAAEYCRLMHAAVEDASDPNTSG
jgi:hypothetical protein